MPPGLLRPLCDASGLLLALAFAGCALFACHPRTIVVTDKQERVRLDTLPRGIRTTETGRIEEAQQITVVHDYWVQSPDGAWYRVSADQFHAAQLNQPIEVCE